MRRRRERRLSRRVRSIERQRGTTRYHIRHRPCRALFDVCIHDAAPAILVMRGRAPSSFRVVAAVWLQGVELRQSQHPSHTANLKAGNSRCAYTWCSKQAWACSDFSPRTRRACACSPVGCEAARSGVYVRLLCECGVSVVSCGPGRVACPRIPVCEVCGRASRPSVARPSRALDAQSVERATTRGRTRPQASVASVLHSQVASL